MAVQSVRVVRREDGDHDLQRRSDLFVAFLDSTCRQQADILLQRGVWCFRFEAQAGECWLREDPWWNGRPAMRRRLKQDGTMEAATDAPGLRGARWFQAGRYQVGTEQGHSVVRVNETPSMALFRHPHHWGFYMQSCWAVWNAFPMAPAGEDPLMEDDELTVNDSDPTQQLEITRYNKHFGL